MKKILGIILAVTLLLSVVPTYALDLLSGEGTYPLNSDKSITCYFEQGPNLHEKFANWHEAPFYTGLNEQLGVDIDFSFPTTGTDSGVYTNTLLADPENLPDIMFSNTWMSNAALYLDEDVIWDLSDYIQEYAPAYYAFLQANPTYDKAMKTDDGQYYIFGFFREDGGWNDTYLGPVVRSDWMAECGLELPKTIDEFENVIRVLNEKYGAKFSFGWNRWKNAGIHGAFGSYGSSDATYYVKDGKVGFAQADEEWRDYLTWLNKLYKEGLLDQDSFSLDDTSIKAKIHNDEVGISLTSMGQLNNWNKERVAAGKEPVWVAAPFPTDNEGNISSVFGGSGIGVVGAVITKCADEETMKLCLQILDYAFTQEGFLYWNFGKQGVSWDYDENGEPAFTALVNDDPDTDPMIKYNGTTWSAPGIQATKLLYLKNSQVAIDANDLWFYSVPLSVSGGWKWPSGTTFTVDESDELDLIASNISTYVTECYANFVTGAQDITDDAVWEAYVANLSNNYNLDRILEIRQACYERYLAR